MELDIPTDLISKAQIGFRLAAGLSSFDPNDTSVPSISTVEASISSLDPSPSHLRCKRCQCKLPRGLQSLICIYCGEYQTRDQHPDPISFKSTHGYSWLLQSLNFNGSERIGSLAEGSGINRGQSPAEDELTISELLDLKISWCKKPENSFDIKTSKHNSSSNLGTIDFDHFFTRIKSGIVSDVLEEQPVASNADQNLTIADHGNFTSDWNAEFQFADTKTKNKKLESVDPFEGAEADLFAHMDASFGKTESFDFEKPNDDSDPFQYDPFANMSSTTFQQNEQLDSVIQAIDGLSADPNNNNLKGADGDWFSDGDWQKSSVKNTLNDSSTDWFENTNGQEDSANNTATVKDDNLFDFKPDVNDLILSEKSNLDDSVKHQSDVADWFQDSQLVVGGSSPPNNIVVNKHDDGDDDGGFDEWNDFTSSTVNQDSFQDSWKESGDKKVSFGTDEKMSELNLFQSLDDSQELDFENFLQSDISPAAKNSTDNQAVYDIFSEVSTANRNGNIEAGNNSQGLENDKITLGATASEETDVQMLMSQMHDLSFMLKDELSVPSKADNVQ